MNTQNTHDKAERPAEAAQDEATLKAALLDLGTADYERIRASLILRLGYDAFRDLQNKIFKQIGTIKAEKGERQ
jgi:hypothetical protein